MTIRVESTTDTTAGIKAANEPEPSAKLVEKTMSAPAPKEQEQKKAQESDPVGTEEEDEQEEAEVEADTKATAAAGSEPAKPKGKLQKRIDKLVAAGASAKAAEATAKQEAEYWRKEAIKNASEKPADQTTAEKKTETKALDPKDPEPDPDKFESPKEYYKALGKWQYRQDKREDAIQINQAKVKTEQEKVRETHFSRMTKFAEETDDFKETISGATDAPVSELMQDIMENSDAGPAMLYHLAKNPAEAQRISKLTAGRQYMEMGKIEAQLAKAPGDSKSEEKQTTRAPEPPTPVGSKGVRTTKSLSDPTLSQREYEALRAKGKTA